MHRWTRKLCLALMPALILSVSLLGCSGTDKKPDNKPKKDNTDDDKGDETAGEMKPVKGKGTTTITGTVTYDGDMAELEKDVKKLDEALLDQINKASAEKDMCLAGSEREKTAYQWRVNKKNKGVKNVFVWIRPATKDEYFDVSDLVKEGKGFEKLVKLDQPHCAFIPHAFTLFQRYVDPKKPKQKPGQQPKTEQAFEVVNSAKRSHNTKWEGQGTQGGNKVLDPGKKEDITDIVASYKKPVIFACSVHPWMKAYAWSFDHPFAAVTDENGKYEIKNVPGGVKVRIVAWHEERGFLKGGEQGEKFDVKDSGATKDFKFSK